MLWLVCLATLTWDEILVTLSIPARLNRWRVIILNHMLLLSIANVASCAVSIHSPACTSPNTLAISNHLSRRGYSLITLISHLSFFKANLSCYFTLEILQILCWDLFCLSNEAIESSSYLSFYLQLLEVICTFFQWVLAEEVTDKDVFNVWFLLRKPCACIILRAASNLWWLAHIGFP